MFPVHGAATAFFQTKFWVLGGSTGDDQYDHTITDKGMFVQNNENVVFSILNLFSQKRKKRRRSVLIKSPQLFFSKTTICTVQTF